MNKDMKNSLGTLQLLFKQFQISPEKAKELYEEYGVNINDYKEEIEKSPSGTGLIASFRKIAHNDKVLLLVWAKEVEDGEVVGVNIFNGALVPTVAYRTFMNSEAVKSGEGWNATMR